MNVIVTHPGAQHSYHVALGLQKAGLLRKYVTGFYYKKPGIFSSILHFLPDRYAVLLERELLRRRKEEINQDLVQTSIFGELLYVFSSRLRFFKRGSGHIMLWRNERFDTTMARITKLERPDAVVCYDSCALKTFKAAKEIGSVTILNQSTAHITKAIKVLNEEARLHPEFADSLFLIYMSDCLIKRCTQEALSADWILAPSKYVRDSLVAIGVEPSKIFILPFGADIDKFRPGPRRDDGIFRILFIGSIGQRKGIKYLLEAFRRLYLPNAELVLVGSIIGSGKGLKPYRKIFTHIPHVPYHELHNLFQNADIFVYPTLHEGSAIAIYEALASGLPVITTPHSGSVIRDGEEGFIVPIRDVEALMEKILILYDNRELRKKMSQKARERAKDFTWEHYYKKLGELVFNFTQKKRI